MSFEIRWYFPKRIIYIHLLGELGLAEVEQMSRESLTFIQEGIAPVHILLDDSKGGQPPISLKELKSRLEIASHPSVGWIVGIGEVDQVAKFLIPLLMKILKLQYLRVENLDAALNFLSRQDLSLERDKLP